jgi:PAS domain-containing protein
MARAGDGIAARVLGSSSSGIVGVDLDGRIVLLNAGARRLPGCSERSIRAALGWDPEAS